MRILIADDEEEMTQALSAILKHEHYSVDTVHDGMAALDYGMAESCDCLVLDIMMPGLDGLQVLKKLRENGISTPVLLLTAKGEVEDRVAGLDCGADDYLRKPFDIEVFLLRVKKLCRAENILKYRELLLNPATMEVSKNGQRLTLTKTEFELLHCFLGNLKTVLSREWLLNHVWGMDFEGDSRTVDTNIRRLRKKIGEDYIRTRVGMGYVMGEENA